MPGRCPPGFCAFRHSLEILCSERHAFLFLSFAYCILKNGSERQPKLAADFTA